MKFRPLVIGNWKMNPATPEEAKKLFSVTKKLAATYKKVDIIVAPPFVYIPLMKVDNKNLFLGAQNAHAMDVGAHTGEVGPVMLQGLGVRYVILGHSERRKEGETSALVNAKIKTVIANKMTAVVCIGEAVHDKDGEYLTFLRTQISETFAGLSRRDIASIIIAYEPIWAIGSAAKGAMMPNDLYETTLYIKKVLSELFTRDMANSIPIVYGGSVDEYNAQSLIDGGNVRGFLVGRASLSRETFLPIVSAANNSK